MKRFDVSGCHGYCYGGFHMKEDVDGEYIRYEDHCEAMKRIGCEVCEGRRGCVPGNENIIDGKVVCDYCHADGSYKSGDGVKDTATVPANYKELWRQASAGLRQHHNRAVELGFDGIADAIEAHVKGASIGGMTDAARRLMLAANDVDLGRSIHNERKPQEKIEGAVWDELVKASSEVRTLLASPAAKEGVDARIYRKGECIIDPLSSRGFERGTKSCVVRHEDARDAARYRWLRDSSKWVEFAVDEQDGCVTVHMLARPSYGLAQLDADSTIDAAQSASAQQAEPVVKAEQRNKFQGPNGARAAICAKCGERVQTSASPAALTDRRCQQCNAPRKGDECHKCGAPTVEPCAGWEEPALPPIVRIRALAREVGYAVGVHGTLERDLDLIAAPWSEDAATLNYREVMQHIADGLGARLVEVEGKPLGRRACTIQMDGWYKPIDLSVCPMLAASPADQAGWQPIETAPKDAMVLLAAEFDHPGDWRIKVGYWDNHENDWQIFGASWEPTQWMPLPPAPAMSASKEGEQ